MKIVDPRSVLPPDPPSVPPDGGVIETLTVVSAASVPSPQIQSPQSSIPANIPSTAAPSYAERFKASLRNLKRISSPVCIEDGTPVVQAPASVLLKAADQWKGHIIAKFHGLIPPSSKIFSDLNPAWGKFGNIVIRAVSDTSCLIMIPCTSTREWVLQVGYWQAGNVSFSVYPWSTDASLLLPELETAPTWAILENIPPQMYSLDGISVIASAIGEPLHTEKSKLDPFYFGNTKVKVEISLDAPPPTTIKVRDALSNSVTMRVSYPRLPPKCCNCGRFGHLLNRCPKPLMRKPNAAGKKGLVPLGSAVALTSTSLASGSIISKTQVTQGPGNSIKNSSALKRTRSRADSRRRAKERSRSSPPVGSSIAHERDQSMSITTQERVKAWIKEKDEERLSAVHSSGSKSKDLGNQWIVVGSKAKDKGKGKEGHGNVPVVSKAYGKPGVAVPLKLFPGMKSVRKIAKLEAKKYFMKKPSKGSSSQPGVEVAGLKVPNFSSMAQGD